MKDLYHLLRLAAPFKWWIALAVLLGSATVASGISLMATSAYLISAAALHPSIAELEVAIVGVRFFGLARGVLRYLERYVSHRVNLSWVARGRVWFYEALEPLAPARLIQFHSGDLLSRAVADLETLQDFYVRVIAPPAVAVLVAAGMMLFMWSLDPTLALVLLAAWLGAGVGVPSLVHRFSRQPAQALIAERAALHTHLVDGIQGLPDILAYGQASRISAAAHATGRSYAAAQTRLGMINAFQNGMGSLLTNVSMLLILTLAIALVNQARFSGVYLAALALATAASFEAVLPLPQAAQALESALAAARRLFDLVDTEPSVQDPAHPAALPFTVEGANALAPETDKIGPGSHIPSPAGKEKEEIPALEIRDLQFAYTPGAPPALEGLGFNVAWGEHLAIVGPSGAGKTTLVNLLLRFWDYDAGEIRLEGVPLRDYAQADIRRAIGVISQQTYLFRATLRENLLIANPQATDKEIIAAAQRARIQTFIESLPNGYDTWIGERGLNLSRGERQRLAIARALLRHTPILILDEPTANLDAATEREFLRELFELMSGRTLVLITHRLVGLEKMDEILVLARGRLVERGTHAELLEREGLYHRLWTLQNRALIGVPT